MSHGIQRFETGKRMSRAVVHGDTVYLCRQFGIPGEGIEAQTREALSRVETLLDSL